jgi:hypothetical protein
MVNSAEGFGDQPKVINGKGNLSASCYSHLLSEEATMVRFIQATISGGKKVYFNADRISAILESSRSDSKSIVYTSGDPSHHTRHRSPSSPLRSVARTFRVTQIPIAECAALSARHHPAGSFFGGFRTPATAHMARPFTAGIRNPAQKQTHASQKN